MNGMSKPITVPGIDHNPDAKLIRLCDRKVQLERLLDGEYSDGRDIPNGCQIMDEMNGNIEKISVIPATTMEDLRARAKAIVAYAPDLKSADSDGLAEKMVAAPLRDLIGGSDA
jgi:hypothetical protein